MLVIIGSIVVLGCVAGGFLLAHGQILALWQPNELIIIFGGAFGAFLSANSPKIVKESLQGILALFKGPRYRKQDYVDLLALLYDIFGAIRKGGLLGMESHVEDPHASPIFSAYPRLIK